MSIVIEVPRGIIPDECMEEFSKMTKEALDESSNPVRLAKAMQELLNGLSEIDEDLPVLERIMKGVEIAEKIEDLIESGEFEEDKETLSEKPEVDGNGYVCSFDVIGHMDAWRRKHHNIFKSADIFWRMYNEELARVI